MTEHNLSFLENYGPIRRRLYNAGRPDIDNLGRKIVARRHASDFAHRRAAMEAEIQAKAEAEIKRVADVNRPQWRVILNKISREHGVPTDDILGLSRNAEIVRARCEAMYWIWYNIGMSKPQIGKLFNRDHSSVYHAIHAHARRNVLPVTRGGTR